MGLCLRMTADPGRAEELAQEAFVRAWSKLDSFRGASAFGTWLHRLTVNIVLSASRKDGRYSQAMGNAVKVEAETVNGSIDIEGVSKSASLESINGSIKFAGEVSELDVETINGRIEVGRVLDELHMESINGPMTATGGRLSRVSIETISGSIRFTGDLTEDGDFEASSLNGSIRLTVPSTISAVFDLSSMSGSISNDFGFEAERTGRFFPSRELSFENGSGAASICIETHNGSIDINTD